jgi:hypothetical protein
VAVWGTAISVPEEEAMEPGECWRNLGFWWDERLAWIGADTTEIGMEETGAVGKAEGMFIGANKVVRGP